MEQIKIMIIRKLLFILAATLPSLILFIITFSLIKVEKINHAHEYSKFNLRVDKVELDLLRLKDSMDKLTEHEIESHK